MWLIICLLSFLFPEAPDLAGDAPSLHEPDTAAYERMVLIVDSLYMRGDYHSALDACDQWIELCVREYGVESMEVWDVRSYKALILMRNSQYGEAEKLHKWILDSVDPDDGEDHQMVYTATLSNYGDLLKNQGEVLKALEVMHTVAAMDSTMGYENDGAHAEVLNNIGVAYETLGNPRTALEYLERSLPISWPENLPYRYANMAENLRQLGDIRQAITYFERAVKLFLKHWGENSPETINCQVNYASLRLSMGDYKTVIDELTRIDERLVTNNQIDATHEVRLRVQRHIALACIRSGEFDLAKKYLDRFLQTSRVLYHDRPEFVQMAQLLRVHYLEKLGLNSEADRLITRLYQNLSGESEYFTFQVELLEKYIGIKSRMGQFNTAVTAQQNLIRQIEDQYGTNSLVFLRNEHRLSEMMYHHGKVDQSKVLNGNLMESLVYQSSFIYPYLSDNGKLQFKKHTRPVVDFLTRTAVDTFHKDEEYMRRFTELHLNYKALTQVYSSANLRGTDTSSVYDAWYQVRQKIEKAYLQPVAGSVLLDSLITRSNELERQLSVDRSATFSAITYSSFKDNISPAETVIQFLKWKDSIKTDHYAALINQANGPSRLVSFDSLPPVTVVWNPDELYEHLWNKLKLHIPHGTDLVIVPEGMFHQVSFYSIYLPVEGKYLFEEFNVRILPNIRPDNSPSGKDSYNLANKVALFGNPKYSVDSSAMVSSSYNMVLSELPSTEKEIHSLHDIFSSSGWVSEVFEQEESNKANFNKIDVKDLSILHIASHGVYRPPGTLVDQSMASDEGSFPAINPMFHSAIYLSDGKADSTSTTESGYLSAYEISNMRFDHLELATLSSCESGLGLAHAGEGVFGLQRGFLMAGARNIISTLAEIPDAATVDFMQMFYKELTGGKSIFESFKSTERYMSERYPPAVWGAFVLIGRGESVLSTGGFSLKWILILVAIGIFVSLGYLLRSRISFRADDDLK